MKFIRFADTLLNLEQVIYFHDATDGDTGPTIYAYLNGPFPVRRECFGDAEAMQARFDELSDMLIGAEPEPVSKGRVMTAGEAAKLPDIVGREICVKANVDYAEDGRSDMPLSFNLIGGRNSWLNENTLIEVLD